jgi:nitrogen fixation NifU-like protein
VTGTSVFYSDKALQYFLDPAHAGEMENPDGVGRVGDITCSDLFVMFIRVENGRLAEISYQIFGCPAAIATCEAVAEMATGKRLEEVRGITDEAVAEFLGGLPQIKLHCSNSAAEVLHRAISDYRTRQGGRAHPGGEGAGMDPLERKEVGENAAR